MFPSSCDCVVLGKVGSRRKACIPGVSGRKKLTQICTPGPKPLLEATCPVFICGISDSTGRIGESNSERHESTAERLPGHSKFPPNTHVVLPKKFGGEIALFLWVVGGSSSR